MNFSADKEEMAKVPIWINLPDLDLHAWSMNGLSKIVSLLGIPLYADQCTSLKQRISYAQVVVEVDLRQISLMNYLSIYLMEGRLCGLCDTNGCHTIGEDTKRWAMRNRIVRRLQLDRYAGRKQRLLRVRTPLLYN